ncbi:hypothetical protein BLIJ_0408 [Bifidobacterium longum subsp. infantis ATCC 15697 = JCM 1222 = DSM 20088]|nr:hypothetical protein BLIJ_0408 [Bifidobacterium longum subsp. infantis ATCC 15697 = JCM 1222 = DSM 20088]
MVLHAMVMCCVVLCCVRCDGVRNGALMRRPRHPSMAGPSFKPLSQDSLGVSRLDGGAVGAAAVVTAARASHVRQGRSATVRAVHGRSSGGLPVRATRVRVGARGLVLRQCHLSILYFVRTIELKRPLS